MLECLVVQEFSAVGPSWQVGRAVLLVLCAALVPAFAQHWELERIDTLRHVGYVQVAKGSTGRLYACYGGLDSLGSAVTRVATRDSTGWHRQDVFHGRPAAGQPSFAVGPQEEMCAMCWDSSNVLWVVERTDTGWSHVAFPYAAGSPSVAYDSSGRLYCGYITYSGAHYYWVARRDDTVWTTTNILVLEAIGSLYAANHCLRFTPDDRAWYLAANIWEYTSHVWGCAMVLLRLTGERWDELWRQDYVSWCAVALAGNDDTVGFCRYPGPGGYYLHYNDEVVAETRYWQLAGMAYDASGAPHIAYLGQENVGPVVYAYRTSFWHYATVPSSEAASFTDLTLDPEGQPLIVFGTPDSGVWLAHGVGMAAAEEHERSDTLTREALVRVSPNPCADHTNIELSAPAACNTRLALLDVCGRVVARIPVRVGQRSAALDVHALPAGVYFVEQQGRSGGVRVRLTRLD